MSLQIYNSLSRKIEAFKPLNPPQVKMYCCGPTVYDFLHVGNFRGAVFYNFLRNWLEEIGYKVTFVYNFTDVDDKIINRANEEGTTSDVISEKYIQEFLKDYQSLVLRKHDYNPKVTESMGPIIDMVQDLITKNKAYVVDGEVLYSIEAFPEYGKLSGRKPDELIAGARVEVDRKKKNPLDFALWKPSKQGEPAWDSPWGKGRPGWHIECSAMIHSLLGDQIDIHGGGTDLTFPHHENEIAQTEGCTGKHFVKYWVHNNMFNFSGQKMSKSLGNIIKFRDFVSEYNPEVFKMFVMSVHYRSVADFSPQTIEYAISALARIYSALSVAEEYLEKSSSAEWIAQVDKNIEAEIQKAQTKIQDAFNNDFSTPEAFASVFEIVRLFNSQIKRGMKVNPIVLNKCYQFKTFIKKFGSYMSLFQEPPKEFLITLDDMLLRKMNLNRANIDRLVQERFEVRKQKDFAKSDELRKNLNDMGISVSDTPEGSFWEVSK